MHLNMENVNDLSIEDCLRGDLKCECGRTHRVNLKRVLIENDAIKKLPSVLRDVGYKKALVVADTHTYEVAGKYVNNVLTKDKFNFNQFVFKVENNDLVPDETAIGKLLTHVEKDTDVIIAVGTGTLNDLSKFISYKLHISCCIIATAPSMDGFASTGAALIVNNLKTTYQTECPKIIIGDINVLKKSPMEMILAGFGDVIGKYSALNDWKLSKIINGEYFCNVVYEMVNNSIKKCISNANDIKKRGDLAIKNLMEALVLTGIAMSFVGNSRPASGSEHHLSHYWEMMFLLENKKAIFHGAKVGIGTVITARLRELVSKSEINFDRAIKKANSFDQNKWKENVVKFYGKAAQGIIETSQKEQTNSIEKRLLRINSIRENLDEIINVIKEVPSSERIKSILDSIGAPFKPQQVGIDEKMAIDAVIMAKEIRTRYTILDFLSDVDLLDEFADKIKKYLKEDK